MSKKCFICKENKENRRLKMDKSKVFHYICSDCEYFLKILNHRTYEYSSDSIYVLEKLYRSKKNIIKKTVDDTLCLTYCSLCGGSICFGDDFLKTIVGYIACEKEFDIINYIKRYKNISFSSLCHFL